MSNLWQTFSETSEKSAHVENSRTVQFSLHGAHRENTTKKKREEAISSTQHKNIDEIEGLKQNDIVNDTTSYIIKNISSHISILSNEFVPPGCDQKNFIKISA